MQHASGSGFHAAAWDADAFRQPQGWQVGADNGYQQDWTGPSVRRARERVKNIVNKAQAIALEEGDWFNEVAHKRHFKRLEEDYKLFEETAREISQLQERLSMAYENIGSGLNRYYEVQ